MLSTFLWWWSIGCFLILCLLMSQAYAEALFAGSDADRHPKMALACGYILHLGVALVWPFVVVYLFFHYRRIKRERLERCKKLRHWSQK